MPTVPPKGPKVCLKLHLTGLVRGTVVGVGDGLPPVFVHLTVAMLPHYLVIY